MDLKGMLQELKRNWMFSALLSIVMGLVLLLFPGITARAVCYLLGGLVMVYGLTRIIRYFQRAGGSADYFQSDLMIGLFGAAIGLFMILRAELVVSLIPVVFGIVLMANAIAGLQRALDARRAGYARWGVLLALAVLTAALSVLLLVNPFASMEIMVSVIGASLIYEGGSDLVTMHLIGKRMEDWKKNGGK